MRDPRSDRRDRLRFFARFFGDNSLQLVNLTFLNINKKQARQCLIARKIEFSDQIRLQKLNAQNDKRAQTDRQQNNPRLISRTIERIDRLRERKRAEILDSFEQKR